MKEGSFDSQMSELDFDSGRAPTDTFEIQKIKTPDQMPERLDLTTLPENLMRSNVIESLINQNDDLMSRLSVTLRRVALLEEKISDSRTESAQFRARYDNLKDQVLVLKEQSRILADRNRRSEEHSKKEDSSFNELKEQIKVLEIRYAELYSTAQEKQLALELTIQKQATATSRITKYRKNLKAALIGFRQELNRFRSHNSLQEFTIQDLRKNLSETTSYITEQAKTQQREIADLTNSYELEVKNLRSQINQLIENNQTLVNRSQDYEKLFNEKVKTENELIIANRRQEEAELRQSAEISDIQKSLARYRNDAKELAIELNAATQNLASQIELNQKLGSERQAFAEQVETLQLLWRDQQNQIERVTEQKNSLLLLNQELSITINEYRREIRELKASTDAAELKNIQLKRDTQKTITAVTAAKTATAKDATEPKPEVKREDLLTPEIMTKIDKVLSELHIGR